MKKPPETRRQVMKFVHVPRLRVRMDFTLDFDRPVSILTARETARKILDHMQVTVDGHEPPDELAEVTFRCPELKRSVKIASAPRITESEKP